MIQIPRSMVLIQMALSRSGEDKSDSMVSSLLKLHWSIDSSFSVDAPCTSIFGTEHLRGLSLFPDVSGLGEATRLCLLSFTLLSCLNMLGTRRRATFATEFKFLGATPTPFSTDSLLTCRLLTPRGACGCQGCTPSSTWRYLDSMILGRMRVRMGRKEASRRGKIILMYGHGQNPSTQSSISWAT